MTFREHNVYIQLWNVYRPFIQLRWIDNPLCIIALFFHKLDTNIAPLRCPQNNLCLTYIKDASFDTSTKKMGLGSLGKIGWPAILLDVGLWEINDPTARWKYKKWAICCEELRIGSARSSYRLPWGVKAIINMICRNHIRQHFDTSTQHGISFIGKKWVARDTTGSRIMRNQWSHCAMKI
jgi:hypothetical protein